jgi:ribosome-associated toxin RatA of RatAB toxin-antitoxin module
MPTVIAARAYPGLSVSRIWAVVRDIGAYATFMDHVLRIDVVEAASDRLVTDWTVIFNGNELQWNEIDIIHDATRTITFSQTEGDLEVWRGSVEVMGDASNSEARYTVEFDLGIPALADLLHPLGSKAVKANCQQMLEAIAQIASAVHPA